MARTGRAFPERHVSAPPVIGPAVVYRPIQVRLTEQQRRAQADTRRAAHSRLRPPTVTAAAVTFQPVTVRLANKIPLQTDKRRAPHSTLRPPQIVGTQLVAFMPDPVKVDLARQGAQIEALRRRVKYAVKPTRSIGVSFIPPPIRTNKTQQSPRFRHTVYKLGQPLAGVTTTVAVPAGLLTLSADGPIVRLAVTIPAGLLTLRSDGASTGGPDTASAENRRDQFTVINYYHGA